jgi:hypothetical protein
MARVFNGSSGYLNWGDSPDVDVAGSYFSIAVLWKPISTGAAAALAAKHDNTLGGLQYALELNSSNQLLFQLGDGASFDSITSFGGVVTQRWYYGCGVKNGNELSVYLNGIRNSKSSSIAAQNTATNMHLGVYSGGAKPNDCHIAYLAIWEAGLWPDEALRLAQGAHPRSIRPESLTLFSHLATYGNQKDVVGGYLGTMNGAVNPRPDPFAPITDEPRWTTSGQSLVEMLTVVPAGQISVGRIEPATVLYTPQLIPGSPTYAPFISPTTSLFTPSIATAAVAPFIAETTTLYEPSVRRASIPVRFLESTTQIFPPFLARALTNVVLPAISGTAMEGQMLEASPGVWSGTEPINYSYQWRRCNAGGGACVDISGATGSTYVVQSADVGGTLRVRVTASNS